MISWIRDFPIRVPFDVTDLELNPIDSRVPFDEGRDEIIDVMNGDEKLVYSLWQKSAEEADRVDHEVRWARGDEAYRRALIAHSKLVNLGALFKTMLVVMISQRLGDDNLGVKIVSGFRIASLNCGEENILDVISQISGLTERLRGSHGFDFAHAR